VTRSFAICFATAAIAVAACTIAGSWTPAQALDVKECSAKYKEAQAAGTLKGMKWNEFRRAQCGATASAAAVFPSAIAPQHAKLPPAKARLETCRDQYNANKGTNANGDLKWIQRGGGYYSECVKRLKG
jgi:hypothetical protein